MGETWRYLVYARGKMTGLFKCVVLSCAVSLVLGLTDVRDDANWLKNGQRIKNRFVTGVVNGIVDVNCDDTEGGNGVEGECMSKLECTKTGGRVGSLCSLLGSCCVIEKTCGEVTSSKISYFVPPAKFQPQCSLTVKTYSKDVCQIRLDFLEFDIAKPTNENIKLDDDETVWEAYKCHNDTFKVEHVTKNLGFTYLCGRNKGQHIYIPVSENQEKIALTFNFRDGAGPNPSKRQWRIKIRQLECRKSGHENLLTAPSKLMAMYNRLKNKKNFKSDYEWIAPPNCLQYYTNHTGTFESFNYDEGKGCYIGNLNYAICFKTRDICGATYKADGLFQMNSNKYGEDDDKWEKCHPQKPAGPKVSQDYIRIPGGVDSLNQYREYYCNRDFDNTQVTVKTFGPLYVGVHTDGFRPNKGSEDLPEEADEFAEIGFRMHYQLTSGYCDAPF